VVLMLRPNLAVVDRSMNDFRRLKPLLSEPEHVDSDVTV